MKININQAEDGVIAVMQAGLPVMLHSEPGIGKALANSELVLTPNGFVSMGELSVGDFVIGDDGQRTQIQYVAPQGVRSIYKITFRDGTSVRCDNEHLWKVKRRSAKTWQYLTTHMLRKKSLRTYEANSRSSNNGNAYRYNWVIPKTEPVIFNTEVKVLPVHPYLLGALLGDGGFTGSNIRFTNPNKEIIDRVRELLPDGYKLNTPVFKQGAYHISIIKDTATISFKQYLDNTLPGIQKLSIHKHIPKDYLLSSLEDRHKLYQGLVDTDGCWKRTSKGKKLVSFDVSSKQLHQDFLFLARSLGMTFSASEREAGYKKDGTFIKCHNSYRAFNITNGKHHGIASIVYDGLEEATCISVNNDSKMFITSGFKPTHNSSLAQQIAEKFKLELIDIRLSQCDPTDLAGFPNIKDDIASYIPMEMWPLESTEIPKGKHGFLLLLDEFNSASLTVQAASYKVVLDRMVGMHKLHPKTAIICAGNLSTDAAIVNRLSTAMQSRLVHLQIEPNTEIWLDWASKNNLDFRVTSYIHHRPEQLHRFDPNHNDTTFGCPRTWHYLSKLITNNSGNLKKLLPVLAGTVGEGAAREFITYSDLCVKLPSLHDILANPTTIHINKEPSMLYAVSHMLASYGSEDNLKKLMSYIHRLPMEFGTITLQNLLRRRPELIDHQSVLDWIEVKGNDLF